MSHSKLFSNAQCRHGEFPSSQLPFSEPLLSLNRLRKHLSVFPFRYSSEPRTEEAFRQRETLREEPGALGEECSLRSGLLKKGEGVLGSLNSDLTSLHMEFNHRHVKLRRYLEQC